MKTEIERICEIMETLLAHEPIIDVPYETINDIAVALVQEGYDNISEYKAEIERLKAENCELTKKLEARLTCDFVKTAQKHAKIDILNKAKERIKTAIDTYFNLDGGGYYLAEDALDDIDELIEEVENEN